MGRPNRDVGASPTKPGSFGAVEWRVLCCSGLGRLPGLQHCQGGMSDTQAISALGDT